MPKKSEKKDTRRSKCKTPQKKKFSKGVVISKRCKNGKCQIRGFKNGRKMTKKELNLSNKKALRITKVLKKDMKRSSQKIKKMLKQSPCMTRFKLKAPSPDDQKNFIDDFLRKHIVHL